MKNLLLSCFLFLPSYALFSQQGLYVLEDAIDLAEMVENGKFQNLNPLNILADYAPAEIQNNPALLIQHFRNPAESPYLHLYFQDSTKMKFIRNAPLSRRNRSVLSAVGGLDVTFFADGLAKFLVDRLKQELTTEYLNQFRRILNDERFKDLKSLFPHTHQILNALDFSNYMVFIEAIREAFYQDYRSMFLNLPEIIENHPAWFAEHPQLRATLELAIQLLEALRDELHPGDILDAFAHKKQAETVTPVLQETLRATNFLSKAFRSDNDRFWEEKELIRQLFSTKHAFPIFLGLLCQELNANDIIIQGFSLREQLVKLENNYVKIKPVVRGLADRLVATETLLIKISKIPRPERTFEDYYQFIGSVTDIFDFGTNIDNWAAFGIVINPAPNDAIRKFIGITNQTNELYFDLQQEQFSSAVLNLNGILETIFGTEYSTKEALIKYGLFTAAVIKAESSDEVKALIESIALPPGSYRMKRESRFSVDLNGYIGGTYGFENLHMTNTSDGSDVADLKSILGISAPVGLSLSTGFHEDSKMSGTLFFSMLDVGALASFRLKDSLTAVLPKIRLQNIFAPGAHFILGLPRTGISFGAGIQLGPYLRDIVVTDTELTTEVRPNYRVALTLTYDIPVLNLKNTQNESRLDRQLRKIEEEQRKLDKMRKELGMSRGQ